MLFRLKNTLTGEVWGSEQSQQSVNVRRTLPGNTESSGHISINGELLSNQKTLSAGQYHSQLHSDNSVITWSESPYIVPDTCLENTTLQPLDFIASAVVEKSCSISAQDLDFGKVTLINNHHIDAQSNITVECTNNTQYSITLRSLNMKNGQFYLFPIQHSGASEPRVAYSLYQDPARTLLWADNGNQKNGQGVGGKQRHSVYGRVLEKHPTDIRSGDYQDTVIVTLSF